MEQMKKNQKGMAMIIVVCIMAVLMALSLALLAASSLLIGNAQNTADEEQVRIFTVSVNRRIEEELTGTADEIRRNGSPAIRSWINEKMSGGMWTEYDPALESSAQTSAIQQLSMEQTEAVGEGKLIRSCELKLFWECLEERKVEEKLADGTVFEGIESELQLTAEITCTTRSGNRYTAATIFGCKKRSDEDEYYWYISGRE